ncbi:MAG TPA: IclR family transcriptional regulator C-terminal domain-containing protein [Usitatibacter sp.]|jgi:IclR family pca regulon transcriptional regulator|nr:IclR family transcriptional regulator C-terminal domain-containing protein [Usitatibacter sp.]
MASDPDFMASLARGLTVLRAFSQQRPNQSISQLAMRTDIPRAAVRRCLHTLVRLGYADHDAERRTFALRPKVLSLGYAYLSSIPLVTLAQPVLDALSEKLHESASLAVLEGDEIVYVARSKTIRRLMSVDLNVGSRLPAYCTSLGRVLLAARPPEELKQYLGHVHPVRYTPRTVISRDQLRGVIEGVRAEGYSVVDEELEIGLRSIAVPVLDTRGHVTAAINASTQASRLPLAEFRQTFLPALRKAAAELNIHD